LISRLGTRALHVFANARITGEIHIDIRLGRLGIDANVLAQLLRPHAVDQAKVDRLGTATLIRSDVAQFNLEHLGRRSGVHVQVVAEGIHQAFVLGQVRHDPQLDLRVVRRQ